MRLSSLSRIRRSTASGGACTPEQSQLAFEGYKHEQLGAGITAASILNCLEPLGLRYARSPMMELLDLAARTTVIAPGRLYTQPAQSRCGSGTCGRVWLDRWSH